MIDPYDILDPVDVLAQLPKDFYTRVVRRCVIRERCEGRRRRERAYTIMQRVIVCTCQKESNNL